MSRNTCPWCERLVPEEILCDNCSLIAEHAFELAKQVAQLTKKGGAQLYIAIERTGQETALLSVKRWSPLEPLENVDCVAEVLATFQ